MWGESLFRHRAFKRKNNRFERAMHSIGFFCFFFFFFKQKNWINKVVKECMEDIRREDLKRRHAFYVLLSTKRTFTGGFFRELVDNVEWMLSSAVAVIEEAVEDVVVITIVEAVESPAESPAAAAEEEEKNSSSGRSSSNININQSSNRKHISRVMNQTNEINLCPIGDGLNKHEV